MGLSCLSMRLECVSQELVGIFVLLAEVLWGSLYDTYEMADRVSDGRTLLPLDT